MLAHVRKVFQSLSILLILSATSVYANCPAPEKIQKSCAGKMCNWIANHPGWEGFPMDDVDHGDTQIVKFNYVIWRDYKNKQGNALCIYTGDKGGLIRMVQGSWVDVPKPADTSIWMPFIYESTPALSCYDDVNKCQFQY